MEVQARLFKNPKIPCLMDWEKLGSLHSQNQHFKIKILNLRMNWVKLYPNWSFNVENKMGNAYNKGWSDLKLNMKDCDIPFPKILETY